MFIKPTNTREKVVDGKKATIMYCPFCQKEHWGSNPAGIFRHLCEGEELFFLNGHCFVGVGNYIYDEQKEKTNEGTTS